MQEQLSVHTIRRFKWFLFNKFMFTLLIPFAVIGGIYALKELLFTIGVPPLFLLFYIIIVTGKYVLKSIGTVEHHVIPEVVILYANPRKGELS